MKQGKIVGFVQLDGIKAALRRARAAAGLPARVTPNLLRHTIACEPRARGVPEGEVAASWRIAGATPPREGYASWRPDHLGQAATAVDAVLNEIGPVLATPARSIKEPWRRIPAAFHGGFLGGLQAPRKSRNSWWARLGLNQ